MTPKPVLLRYLTKNRLSECHSGQVMNYEPDFYRANFSEVGKRLDPRQVADFNAIISHMCITLYKIAHTAIRRWDNNHLILGSFVKEWALSGESWKVAAPPSCLIVEVEEADDRLPKTGPLRTDPNGTHLRPI